MAGACLIAQTKLSLDAFLPLARDLVGYSVAQAADSVPVPLPPMAHNLACYSSFKDRKASPSVRLAEPFYGLFSTTFLVATFENDMAEVLETAGGMEFAIVDTVERRIQAAIIHGTLAQWRRAILRACGPKTKLEQEARQVYTLVFNKLCQLGLREMFDTLKVGARQDRTLLLESK